MVVDLGPCPLCGRPMIAGPSVDEHHWVPKSQGGREAGFLHRVCHRQLHELFSERDLAARYSTPDAVRADSVMARFIAWVRKRPPEYTDWPKSKAHKSFR
jgi:hypothetical protein